MSRSTMCCCVNAQWHTTQDTPHILLLNNPVEFAFGFVSTDTPEQQWRRQMLGTRWPHTNKTIVNHLKRTKPGSHGEAGE